MSSNNPIQDIRRCEKVFLVTGETGTGKSVLIDFINVILKKPRFGITNPKNWFMGYQGQETIVFWNNISARNIHKIKNIIEGERNLLPKKSAFVATRIENVIMESPLRLETIIVKNRFVLESVINMVQYDINLEFLSVHYTQVTWNQYDTSITPKVLLSTREYIFKNINIRRALAVITLYQFGRIKRTRLCDMNYFDEKIYDVQDKGL